MNDLCLNPEDRCPTCGTNLRESASHLLRPCPMGCEPEDAA